jgi:hypothetical protein
MGEPRNEMRNDCATEASRRGGFSMSSGVDLWPIIEPEGFPADDFFLTAEQDEATKLLTDWFFANFEDPAHSTPYESREGGYQYIWGGPYEAENELLSRFGNVLNDDLLEAAVAAIEDDGIVDWAPHSNRLYEGPDDDDFGPEAEVPAYLRADALRAIDELETALREASSTAGIGHNFPPEPIDSDDSPLPDEQRRELDEVLASTRNALGHQAVSLSFLQKARAVVGAAALAVGKWLAKKADKAVDAAIEAGVPAAMRWGAIYLATQHLDSALVKIIEAFQ